MRKHVFLATCLLALLFSCSTKKEQEEVIVQSLTHEVLMGDEYLIGKESWARNSSWISKSSRWP